MKPTNQVAKKHNLGDKSSQSQKTGLAEGAAPGAAIASKVGAVELADLMFKQHNKLKELAHLMLQMTELTPDAFKADQAGIVTSARKTKKEVEELGRNLRKLVKLIKTERRHRQATGSLSRDVIRKGVTGWLLENS